MNGVLRATGLPALALVLVAGVLGMQAAAGGGNFTPTPPVDPCAGREVTTQADGLEGLTEQLVLIGIDEAACTLGESREALTLELAQQDEPTDEQVDAVRAGLRDAVTRLAAEDALPPSSKLVDEALDGADLNRFVAGAIRALPDSVIDRALPTDEVLLRAVDELDVRAVLSDLDDSDALRTAVQEAITEAVKDQLLDRVRNLV